MDPKGKSFQVVLCKLGKLSCTMKEYMLARSNRSTIQAVSVGCKWGLQYSLVCLQLILSLVCKGFGVEDLSKVVWFFDTFLSSASYAALKLRVGV